MKVKRSPSNGKIMLTPGFSFEDFAQVELAHLTGVANIPSPFQVPNLFKLAILMEKVHAALDHREIKIVRAFESVALQSRFLPFPDPMFLEGCACTFRVSDEDHPLSAAEAVALIQAQNIVVPHLEVTEYGTVCVSTEAPVAE